MEVERDGLKRKDEFNWLRQKITRLVKRKINEEKTSPDNLNSGTGGLPGHGRTEFSGKMSTPALKLWFLLISVVYFVAATAYVSRKA